MNNREMRENGKPLDVGPRKYIAPADAAQAIHILQQVLDRLEANRGQDRLQACIAFAQEALWAAAYPNDPNTMLDQVADQAQNAMG